jgi:hypothetical protein
LGFGATIRCAMHEDPVRAVSDKCCAMHIST